MMTKTYQPHGSNSTPTSESFGPLDGNSTSPSPLYKEPNWASFVILGLVFAGAVVGMGGMGYLGDSIGRKRAYCLTLGFIVFGSLGAALLPWGTAQTVFGVLSVCRFVLGIGVGGLYPLSAVKAAESTAAGADTSTRTGWAFFWQTPGAMVPYVVGWILVQISRNGMYSARCLQLPCAVGSHDVAGG
jgi:PHS family inorganic phosphate transporter-like MFS transporter